MPLLPANFAPGFSSQETQLQNDGQWFDGNLVRWRRGGRAFRLEKMGGWQRLVPTACLGLIRKMHAWQDLDNHHNLLLGTDGGPEVLVNSTLYPLFSQVALTGGGLSNNASFSSTIGSTLVTVFSSTQVLLNDLCNLQMPVSIGGRILPTGFNFPVVATIPSSQFAFNMPLPALFSQGPVPGIPLFTNTAVNILTCSLQNHGFIPGQTFTIDQTTQVSDGALSMGLFMPAGTVVTILTTPTADTFTFAMPPNGSAGLGLGSAVYEGVIYYNQPTYVPPLFLVQPSTVISISRTGTQLDPQNQSWSVDNLGQNGLMVAGGRSLQVYSPPINNGPWLSVVSTAPSHSNGMFVGMPQAQVVLWGTEAVIGSGIVDPLLVRFSDVGTFDTWSATVSNQAGSYRLSRGSQIVGGIQAPQTSYLFTDTDAWSMSYIGPPLVNGFTIVGEGCGLIGPQAVATLGRTTVWMSRNSFWQLGDGGGRPLPCDVWDYIFRDLDTANLNKIVAGANSSTNEVAFFFPSVTDGAAISQNVNMMLWSQVFPHTEVWFPFDAIGNLSGGLAPDGGASGQLVEGGGNSMHAIGQSTYKPLVAARYTFSVYAKNTSARNLGLMVNSTAAGNPSVYAVFDPVAGTVLASGVTGAGFGNAFALISASVTTDGLGTGANGWRRYVLTFTSDDGPILGCYLQNAVGTATVYAGAFIGGAVIWGAQLNRGDLAAYVQTSTPLLQNEPTRYVKVQLESGLWDTGILSRTAWLNNSVFGTALGGDRNSLIQQHEMGYDDDGSPMRNVFAESGYIEIGDGTQMFSVHEFHPDFKWFGNNGGVSVTLKSVNYPDDEPQTQGPFTTTPSTRFVTTRSRARYQAVRYDWAPLTGFSARVGETRFRVKPTGRRP